MAQFYTFHDCAGCCGILADALLGHCPVGAIEQSAHARSVLFQRQRDGLLPPFPVWDDTRTFRTDNPECAGYIEGLKEIADSLAICAGTPCTDISPAGKRTGVRGSKSALIFETLRIVGEVRPRFFMLENSAAIVYRGLDLVTAELAALGYVGRWGTFSAAHVGAPHRRERVFLVAHRGQARREGGRTEPEHVNPWAFHAAESWWVSEPRMGRVVSGTAAWLDRIERLGQAYIPQVAALAWETLT